MQETPQAQAPYTGFYYLPLCSQGLRTLAAAVLQY